MTVLGVETSCDETAAALVTEDGRILSNVVSSQAELHARYEISLEQYNALFDPSAASLELRSAAWQRMHDTMLNRTVFFLHKGERRLDSRGHDGLAHRMSVSPETASSPDGAPVTLTFTITNTGTAHWLHQGPHIFGLVRLACHSYDEQGALVVIVSCSSGVGMRNCKSSPITANLPHRKHCAISPGSGSRSPSGIVWPARSNSASNPSSSPNSFCAVIT